MIILSTKIAKVRVHRSSGEDNASGLIYDCGIHSLAVDRVELDWFINANFGNGGTSATIEKPEKVYDTVYLDGFRYIMRHAGKQNYEYSVVVHKDCKPFKVCEACGQKLPCR